MRRSAVLAVALCTARLEVLRALRPLPQHLPHQHAPAVEHPESRPPLSVAARGKRQTRGKPVHDLAMVHVPVNFGHTIESIALRTSKSGLSWAPEKLQMSMPNGKVLKSFQAKDKDRQWSTIRKAMGTDGEVWGMMNPDLRPILNATGCDMYYSPQKYWPQDVAERYFSGKQSFGVLRDPYDRMANIFRNQVQGVSSVYKWTTRMDISQREGDTVRTGPRYKMFYDTCDVNAWLKEELALYKKGDIFRADCILMPQADFFDGPHGISVPIDNRRLPESFNEAMAAHGYDIQMGIETVHNFMCNNITSRSFDEESRALIKEVYARDFELVCKHFGYCDRDEMTCLHQFPQMCGE